MTALTWKQAKAQTRCDCTHRDPAQCKATQEFGIRKCGCHCHYYMRDAESLEQLGTERAK